jgi:hypothetical protein
MSAPPASSLSTGGPRHIALFFPLLIAATAITFVVFPLASYVLPEDTSLADLTVALFFLGSGGHVAASFFFYTDAEMRERLLVPERNRFLVVPVAIVIGSALFFGLAGLVPEAWGATVYWVWQTHHYARQNHGMLAFASRADGIPISMLERSAITLTGIAAIIGMITFVTPTEETRLFDWNWYIHTVALGVFACAWLLYALSIFRQRHARPTGRRSLVLLVLMLFFLPLFLFTDPLCAVFTYAVAHGLQYLVFMGFVVARPRPVVGLGALVAFVLIGGGLLFVLQRREGIMGAFPDTLYGAYLGIVMWHFLLDAGVWRLSEPFQRRYMSERFDFLR